MDGLKAAVRTDCRVKTGTQDDALVIQAGRRLRCQGLAVGVAGSGWILELVGFADRLDGAVTTQGT